VKLGPVKILSSPLNNQIYAKHSQSGDSKTISHAQDLKQDNKTGHKIDRTQSIRTHTQAGTDKSGYSASNNKDTSIGTYSKRIAQPTTLHKTIYTLFGSTTNALISDAFLQVIFI
jgi:hypothetical protein